MAYRSLARLSGLAALVGAAAMASCSNHLTSMTGGTGASTTSGGTGGGSNGFQADPPRVYLAKVKNVLVGLPPTDAEIQEVTADPTQLKTLIDGWMKLPEYPQKMMRFFELAFQQTQIDAASFAGMIPPDGLGNGYATPSLFENIQESFARTVLQLVADGRSFSEAMTTKQLMMTPPLMELYAFLDTYHVDDNGKVSDDFLQYNPTATTIVEGTAGMSSITLAQSADPASPSFMLWYNPDIASLVSPASPQCDHLDPITAKGSSTTLHSLLYGASLNHTGGSPPVACRSQPTKDGVLFAAADFAGWKMVTIRPPKVGEATTRFYDIPALRTATELVINTPRTGFFSTPAFFANWPTDRGNQMRVTLNQALIVALGAAVDGTDATPVPPNPPGLDGTIAQPGTTCYGCHQYLDPARAIFSATWTNPYYTQLDPTQIAQKGQFIFQGVTNTGIHTIDDFAKTLASHPLLPSAWAQKLCYYVNSSPCLPDDPEFQRIVGVFQSSNRSWSALVRELLSSPLTTNASPTKTTDAAEVVSVARRDHLCAALDFRLDLVDVCGLLPGAPSSPTTQPITEIVPGLPTDGYGRGSAVPVLPTQPTLFYWAGMEDICEAVAALVIDSGPNPAQPNAKQWSSQQPDAAIADFVSILMAVEPSDPRSAELQMLLKEHFTDSMQMGGAGASDALKSTFTAACLSPSTLGIGM